MVDPEARRAAIAQQVEALEAQLVRLRQEWVTLGHEQPLHGLFLTVEVAGVEALLPAEAVLEIVRLVHVERLPTAPAHVLGTFLYRGTPAVAVDLGVLLGVAREPDLEAHLVMCGGTRTVGLLVDRVRDMVEAPLLVDGALAGGEAAARAWDRSGMMAGLCRTPSGLLPLLRPGALFALPALEAA